MSLDKTVKDTKKLLEKFDIPDQYINELMCLVFLTLLNQKENIDFSKSTNKLLRIHDILEYIRTNFREIAENTREQVRKKVIRVLEQAVVIERNKDDKTRSINSGKTCYSITDEAFKIIKSYKSNKFDVLIKDFLDNHTSLKEQYQQKRDIHRIPIRINEQKLTLSSGEHNELQVAVINELGPRFAKGSKLLYLGDTKNKYIYLEKDILSEIGIPLSKDDKMQLPDIIFYDEKKNWIFLIEAVTTHGPIDQKRINDLKIMFKNCNAEKIYITAFPNRTVFRKYIADVAWESEVWLSDAPDHMIHFNGDKFMGPYEGN